LEREFKFFNRLEGHVCTPCAPGDQEKSSDGQREQGFRTGVGPHWSADVRDTFCEGRGQKRELMASLSFEDEGRYTLTEYSRRSG
jgi:hypothetical protein